MLGYSYPASIVSPGFTTWLKVVEVISTAAPPAQGDLVVLGVLVVVAVGEESMVAPAGTARVFVTLALGGTRVVVWLGVALPLR